MKRTTRILATAMILFSAAPHAAILYDAGPPNNAQWRNSDFSNQFGGQAADNFVLAADSILTGIDWYGSYLFTSAQPMADDFSINLYSDAANTPADTVLHAASLTSAVSRTFTGDIVSTDFGDFEMYRYSVGISPFSLAAGTSYWLSIVNETSDITQFGGWAWAYNLDGDDPSFVGDATHRWIREGGDWTAFGSSNLAFALFGDVIDIPEPPLLALLAAGLVFLGFTRHAEANKARRRIQVSRGQ